MENQYFFGYGSLVNAATHRYEHTQPARLTGYRRIWRHTNASDVAFLSVTPDPDAQIDGLVAHVVDNDWAALDIREENYTRSAVPPKDLSGLAEALNVQIYQTRTDRTLPDATRRHPILLSYLDCVVQGYHAVFAETGVQAFFDSTSGWDTAVLDDRRLPRYPRHQTLSSAETELVDHHLARLSVRIERP